MPNVVLTEKAESDLDDIHDHYREAVGADTAINIISTLLQCFQQLELFPGSGRPSVMPMYENWPRSLSLRCPVSICQRPNSSVASAASANGRSQIGKETSQPRQGCRDRCPIFSKPRNTAHRIHQITHRNPVTLRQLAIALHQLHLFGIEPTPSPADSPGTERFPVFR